MKLVPLNLPPLNLAIGKTAIRVPVTSDTLVAVGLLLLLAGVALKAANR